MIAATLAERLREFHETWEVLADQGRVDSPLGAEYRRVLAEWILGGCPSVTAEFLCDRAKAGPEGHTPSSLGHPYSPLKPQRT